MATSFLRTGRICCGLKVSVCVCPSWRGVAAVTYSTQFGDPKRSNRRTHIKKAKPKPKLDVAQLLISLGMRPPARPSSAEKPAALNVPTHATKPAATDVLTHAAPATLATPTAYAARASGTGPIVFATATTPVPTGALPPPDRPIPAGDSDAAPPPPTNELPPSDSAPQHTEPEASPALEATAESFPSRGSAPLKKTEAESAAAGITVMEADIPSELTADSSPSYAVESRTPLESSPASAVDSITPLESSPASAVDSRTPLESSPASAVDSRTSLESSPASAVDSRTPLESSPVFAVDSRTPLEPSLLSTLNSSAETETDTHESVANYALGVTEALIAPEVVPGISPGVTADPDEIGHESRVSPTDPVSDASTLKASVPEVSLVSERAALAAPGIITASPAQDAAVKPAITADHVVSAEHRIAPTRDTPAKDTSTSTALAEATSIMDISTTMATPTVAQTAEAESLQEAAVVLGDVPEEAAVLGDVPEEAAVLGDAPEEAAVLGDVPEETAVLGDVPKEAAVILGDVSKEAALVLRDVSEEAAVLGDVSKEAAVVLGDVPEEAAVLGDAPEEAAVLGDVSKEAAVLGDVSKEAAVVLGDVPEEAAVVLGDVSEEEAVVLGDVSEEEAVILGDVSEKAAVLGDVSEEAAVLEAVPDVVCQMEALSLLEVASFLESIPTLKVTAEEVSPALFTPAEDVMLSEIASQLEIAPFLESSSVPDLTPHVEAISLLEVASFLETVPSPDATVASEDPAEPGPSLEDVSVPDLTASVQAVCLLEVGVFLEDISAPEEDLSPLGISSLQASPTDSLPAVDDTSLLELSPGLQDALVPDLTTHLEAVSLLEDALVPDLTTHLEAVSLLEVAQFLETVPDTDRAAVRFVSESPAISTEDIVTQPCVGGTPYTDRPPLDHTSSGSTATWTSPEIDSTPTETSTEQDFSSAGTSSELLGAAKSLQSDLESTDINVTIPTYPVSVDITMTTSTDSVSEHVTMTIPSDTATSRSLTEAVSEVISVASLDVTPGGAGITCDEAGDVAQAAPAEIASASAAQAAPAEMTVPAAPQEPPPNMQTQDAHGSAQIAAPREELGDSGPTEELSDSAPREEHSDLAPREELAQESTEAGLDPVQKLFLQKIREYQTFSQSAEGAVLMAAELQQRLAEEEAKLQKLYGGYDLTEFPEFHFPEPRLDEASTK